jgi:hypothetical protein
MSLFRSRFRVLVLKNDKPAEPHHSVLAVCLELNPVGRGETEPEALEDLTGLFEETLDYAWQNKVSTRPDPDPELEAAFESDASAVEGSTILDRLRATVETQLVRVQQGQRQQSAVYEPCFA